MAEDEKKHEGPPISEANYRQEIEAQLGQLENLAADAKDDAYAAALPNILGNIKSLNQKYIESQGFVIKGHVSLDRHGECTPWTKRGSLFNPNTDLSRKARRNMCSSNQFTGALLTETDPEKKPRVVVSPILRALRTAFFLIPEAGASQIEIRGELAEQGSVAASGLVRSVPGYLRQCFQKNRVKRFLLIFLLLVFSPISSIVLIPLSLGDYWKERRIGMFVGLFLYSLSLLYVPLSALFPWFPPLPVEAVGSLFVSLVFAFPLYLIRSIRKNEKKSRELEENLGEETTPKTDLKYPNEREEHFLSGKEKVKRIRSFISEHFASENPEKDLLLFGHGGVFAKLFSQIFGITDDFHFAEMRSIYVLEKDGKEVLYTPPYLLRIDQKTGRITGEYKADRLVFDAAPNELKAKPPGLFSLTRWTNFVRHSLSVVFFMGLGVVLFSSSVGFGIADVVQGSSPFMPLLENSWLVFSLTGLLVAFAGNWIMQRIRSSVSKIPSSQIFAAASELEEIIKNAPEGDYCPTDSVLEKVLLHIKTAKELLSSRWQESLLSYGELEDTSRAELMKQIGEIALETPAAREKLLKELETEQDLEKLKRTRDLRRLRKIEMDLTLVLVKGGRPKFDLQNRDLLKAIFQRLTNKIDPYYRPKSRHVFRLIASFISFTVSMLLLFSILGGLRATSEIALFVPVTIGLTLFSWGLANRFLKNTRGGPYAVWAVVLGMVSIIPLALAIVTRGGPFLLNEALPLAPLLITFAVLSTLSIFVFAPLAEKYEGMGKAERKKEGNTFFFGAAEKFWVGFKILLIPGFMFLAFLSMVVFYKIIAPGASEGMFDFVANVISQTTTVFAGQLWLVPSVITIFSASMFIASYLLKSISEASPSTLKDYKNHKKWIWGLGVALKLLFVAVILSLMSLPSVFPEGSKLSMLPVFLMAIVVMPMFSGRVNSPWEVFNSKLNALFELKSWKSTASLYLVIAIATLSVIFMHNHTLSALLEHGLVLLGGMVMAMSFRYFAVRERGFGEDVAKVCLVGEEGSSKAGMKPSMSYSSFPGVAPITSGNHYDRTSKVTVERGLGDDSDPEPEHTPPHSPSSRPSRLEPTDKITTTTEIRCGLTNEVMAIGLGDVPDPPDSQRIPLSSSHPSNNFLKSFSLDGNDGLVGPVFERLST